MTDYFGNQTDLVPPTSPVIPPPPPPTQPVSAFTSEQKDEYVGLPVRAMGDRVFLLKGGKKYWITSPEVYEKLGFKFGDEAKIDQATLDVLPEGEPIKL